jgi:hypothetical protein
VDRTVEGRGPRFRLEQAGIPPPATINHLPDRLITRATFSTARKIAAAIGEAGSPPVR